jgi:hypothetical protein
VRVAVAVVVTVEGMAVIVTVVAASPILVDLDILLGLDRRTGFMERIVEDGI